MEGPKMVLYVPKHIIHRNPKPRDKSGIGSYLSLGMLRGKEYLPADLVGILSRFRRSDVIRWITAVGGWIGAEHGMEIRKQMQIAEAILPDELQGLAAD